MGAFIPPLAPVPKPPDKKYILEIEWRRLTLAQQKDLKDKGYVVVKDSHK